MYLPYGIELKQRYLTQIVSWEKSLLNWACANWLIMQQTSKKT